MSKQSSAIAAFGLLGFGLTTDRGVSLGCFWHPVGMATLLFSGELFGTDPVQYAFGICPDKHIVWCLFDLWLGLLRSDKAIDFIF